MKKWDYMKLKSFFIAKESHQTQETSHRMGENLSHLLSKKGLISRINRELKKLSSQRINTPMKNWAHE
jgi:hypothetical protein